MLVHFSLNLVKHKQVWLRKPKWTIIWNKGSTTRVSTNKQSIIWLEKVGLGLSCCKYAKTDGQSINFAICIGLSSVDHESSSLICDINIFLWSFLLVTWNLLHPLAFGRFVTKGISLWSTIVHVNIFMGVYPYDTHSVPFFNQSSMKELPYSTSLLWFIIV